MIYFIDVYYNGLLSYGKPPTNEFLFHMAYNLSELIVFSFMTEDLVM